MLPRTFPQHCSGRRGGAHANGAQTEPCDRLQDREARTLTHFLHAFSPDFTICDADENEQYPSVALCTMYSHRKSINAWKSSALSELTQRIEIPRTSKTPDFTIVHEGDTPLAPWYFEMYENLCFAAPPGTIKIGFRIVFF